MLYIESGVKSLGKLRFGKLQKNKNPKVSNFIYLLIIPIFNFILLFLLAKGTREEVFLSERFQRT